MCLIERYLEPLKEENFLSGEDIEQGAKAIIKALGGKYRSPCGQLKDVHGDLTKVPYVENLPLVARRLLVPWPLRVCLPHFVNCHRFSAVASAF